MKKKIKIIGYRSGNIDSSWKESNVWLHTVNHMRKERGICPRGIYRFKTFEKADEWMKNMMINSYRGFRQ